MNETHIAKATILLNAPAARVWDALVNPDMIRQYLFGTEVHSDWQAGSPITYEGVWQGKAYQDKGQILEIVPEQRLVSTYWSSLAGLEDRPENYQTVRHELSREGSATRLKITQDNNATPEDAEHSSQNWKTVLEGIQKLLEGER